MSTASSSDLSPSAATSLGGLLDDRRASWRETLDGSAFVTVAFLAAAATAFAIRVLRRR